MPQSMVNKVDHLPEAMSINADLRLSRS